MNNNKLTIENFENVQYYEHFLTLQQEEEINNEIILQQELMNAKKKTSVVPAPVSPPTDPYQWIRFWSIIDLLRNNYFLK